MPGGRRSIRSGWHRRPDQESIRQAQGVGMHAWKRIVFVLSLLILPASAYAQGSLAGVVKDSSGGVLPGVTVDASSSVLIEKTRSAVTDATGQYRIPDLTPGIYTVTFTLPGFATIRRENVDL